MTKKGSRLPLRCLNGRCMKPYAKVVKFYDEQKAFYHGTNPHSFNKAKLRKIVNY